MKRIKQKYDVFWVGRGTGCYAENYCREYAGSTFAVSEAQAVNNIRHRTGVWEHTIGDYAEEGYVDFFYEAILAE